MRKSGREYSRESVVKIKTLRVKVSFLFFFFSV